MSVYVSPSFYLSSGPYIFNFYIKGKMCKIRPISVCLVNISVYLVNIYVCLVNISVCLVNISVCLVNISVCL